ncbi:MAG TPA: CRISPR-associated endonuclease Cas2 [Verrucomicrobiota bacterium]|nr:CRISPR-associated endonuclease Cas2 [Verrucomicrobiota bacterium]
MPAPAKTLYLVAYDIPSQRRRTRLANQLEDFGVRVQRSVFECELTLDLLRELRRCISRLIDGAEDNVRIYSLCADCAGHVASLGARHPVEEDPNLLAVQ